MWGWRARTLSRNQRYQVERQVGRLVFLYGGSFSLRRRSKCPSITSDSCFHTTCLGLGLGLGLG